MKQIIRIICGGQTGVDRAAFDYALENKLESGGFVPRNRLAEDGVIPAIYRNLCETETDTYAERTRLNVTNSDATLILSHGDLTGGSLHTKQFAEQHKKPFLHIDFSVFTIKQAVEKTRCWLSLINCQALNIAGPRYSEDPKIYDKTRAFLTELFD